MNNENVVELTITEEDEKNSKVKAAATAAAHLAHSTGSVLADTNLRSVGKGAKKVGSKVAKINFKRVVPTVNFNRGTSTSNAPF